MSDRHMMKFFKDRVWLLAICSFFAIILISFFKTSLELEDAEQAYYSQWFRLGYGDQPPLYTWLQMLMNKVFGVTRFSLAGLRALSFAATILVFYSFAKKYLKLEVAQWAVFSLMLIPVFIDFNFRRLSHTNLMCLWVMVTLWAIAHLREKKHWRYYFLLGLCVGLGLLTKYNFLLFVLSLLVLPFIDKDTRGLVLNPRIGITIGLALVLTFPHFYWLMSKAVHVESLQASIAEKARVDNSLIPILSPIVSYLKTLSMAILPLLLLVLLGFITKRATWKKSVQVTWLSKLFWIQLCVLAVVFIVLDAHKIERRWLLPLFLPFVVLLFQYVSIKNSSKLTQIGFMLFMVILGVQTLRTPVEKLFDLDSSVHHSFAPLLDKLEQQGSDKTWILPDVTYAGSIRFLYPEKKVFFLDDLSTMTQVNNDTPSLLVTKERSIPYEKAIKVDSLPSFGYDKDDLLLYALP